MKLETLMLIIIAQLFNEFDLNIKFIEFRIINCTTNCVDIKFNFKANVYGITYMYDTYSINEICYFYNRLKLEINKLIGCD